MLLRALMQPGATVWLVPRTPTAPGVCYSRPRAVIVELGTPYVTVRVGGAMGSTYRVHEDNVTVADPHRDRPHPAPRPRPAPSLTLPDGWEEVSLW